MSRDENAKDFKYRIHNVANEDLYRVQKAETKFLKVSEKQLFAILKKSTPISELTETEAMVDLEYLTLICLHHRRAYYRCGILKLELESDCTYDLVEERALEIQERFPHLAPSPSLLDAAEY
ncbi:hypothetical protein [Candidatus Liberibacter sp.]|uniref:hypothetical protein n=1 Tax=Candidatus Liberibacter sp. TaxID=34022 RepID=UPI0015F74101|nr:hypothetical protein [Candidatus Liberibacter sp.]MBA5724281.1 hypothetical protein [Candidatus Liberibacter sp.]